MIAGIFHQGSGLGDQLMRYITVRTLAESKGFEWGFYNKENFKGKSFMNLDLGKNPPASESFWNPDFKEKDVRENGIDIRSYDPEINFVEDRTFIDGSFEDDKYWGDNLNNIREWLVVEPLEMADDLCVIGFRGGEYASDPNLFLTKDYWNEAIAQMLIRHPNMRFEVHTDDPARADNFFPLFPKIHDIALNWRSVRYAKHLIIANSAFYIMPALLGTAEDIFAPRFWARRNIGIWARPACFYKRFTYL